ncbi:Ctf19p NDAI_0C06390 [Naumovozyma dairenensis CBS 421]|uniref:Uncharacterized protein n=1 Tax=Naumovozyma dairenensis (strain ATCC 10597 / BCRC 20456 / CBS 421 / NBRC 0211 / NRRL Y-12639) TaxID=1071378 RepID=G0W937_NAUDC|nr:hypothetical protein NDAI_0C06390 [Naumovozyma dairenensis CBS 421]CCD24298.1 hypothetical protein NDAI_0C06390 [Naumovozyma dairenensis CBS 421]
MDFTSDLMSGENHSSIRSPTKSYHHQDASKSELGSALHSFSSNSNLGSELLNEEDLKRFKLQEEKEQLLNERNTLLQEIKELEEKKRNDISHAIDKDITDEEGEEETNSNIIDENALQLFKDILALNNDEKNIKILPVLNLRRHLNYLRLFTYPFIRLSIRSHDDVTNKMTIDLRFNRMVEDSLKQFTLTIELKYYSNSSLEIENYDILSISPHDSPVLYKICQQRNANVIDSNLVILQCYEYDRLQYRRNEILQSIIKEIKSTSTNDIQSTEDENKIRFNMVRTYNDVIDNDTLVIYARDIELSIAYEIKTKVKSLRSGNELIVPCTVLHVILKKNGDILGKIDADEITYELVKQFGVLKGLTKLYKLCFSKYGTI